MIIKGESCGGARRLGIHLTRLDTNERADVKEIRGVVSDNIYGALKEIEAVSAGAMTGKPFYHASINTRADERLTDEQRMHAIDKLETALGLTGQPRIVVIHEKHDREHCHIVWSRIDLDRMAAISDSHNYRKHELVARALEKEFGHERVQGVHVERDGKPRPERTPSHAEMLQAERTGISPQEAKELMTSIWANTKNGEEFQTALAEKGWTLARGDRRDFVAVDPRGGTHSIARRIEGANVADVRRRFADIDMRTLPSVADTKSRHREIVRQGPLRSTNRNAVERTSRQAPRAATVANQPRSASPLARSAGSAAGKIGGSIFSALMGETRSQPKERKGTPPPQAPDAQEQRRQDLMRQLSRPVAAENERDAEIELDKGRERRRE